MRLDSSQAGPRYAPGIKIGPRDEPPQHTNLVRLLDQLYSDELRDNPQHEYLTEHAARNHVEAQVTMFRWYWPWIASARSVLDWGCQHGPDAAMLRWARSTSGVDDGLTIDGCDFAAHEEHPHFRVAAGMNYSVLGSTTRLPYADGQFDAVIAAGVIEHVASDTESLRELHRVMQPGARLIVTFLPSATSIDERLRRRKGLPHHERLYTRRIAERLLLHNGFRPLTPVCYQSLPWQRQTERILGPGRVATDVARALGAVVPLQVVHASTLCVVAEKAQWFA
jgi:SAM-dependent methyltransferase